MLDRADSRLANESFNPGNLCKGRRPYAGLVYVAFKLKDADEQLFDNDSSTEHDVARNICPESNEFISNNKSISDVPGLSPQSGESSSEHSSRLSATFRTQPSETQQSFQNQTNEKSHTTSGSAGLSPIPPAREISHRSLRVKRVATESVFQHEEPRQESHTQKGRKSKESAKRVSFGVSNSKSSCASKTDADVPVKASDRDNENQCPASRSSIGILPSAQTYFDSCTDKTPEISQVKRVADSSERRIFLRTQEIDAIPQVSQKTRIARSTVEKIFPRTQGKTADEAAEVPQETVVMDTSELRISPKTLVKTIDGTSKVSQETRLTGSLQGCTDSTSTAGQSRSKHLFDKSDSQNMDSVITLETIAADNTERRYILDDETRKLLRQHPLKETYISLRKTSYTDDQKLQKRKTTKESQNGVHIAFSNVNNIHSHPPKCQEGNNSISKDNIEVPASKRKRLNKRRKQESELDEDDNEFSNRTGLDQAQNKSKITDKRQMGQAENSVNATVSEAAGQNNQQPRVFGSTVCGKGILCRNYLEKHENIQAQTKLYKCTYCRRAFTDSSNLIKHKKRHLEKKANCESIERKSTNDSAVDESLQEASTSRSAREPFAQHEKVRLAMKQTNDSALLKPGVSQNSLGIKMRKTGSICNSEQSNLNDRSHDVQSVRITTEHAEVQSDISQTPSYSCTSSIHQSNACLKGKSKTHKNQVHAPSKKFICKYCGKRFMASVNCKKHEQKHERKAKHYDGITESAQPFLVQQSCASTSSGQWRIQTTDKPLNTTIPCATEKRTGRDSNSSDNIEKHSSPRKLAKQPTIEHFFGKN